MHEPIAAIVPLLAQPQAIRRSHPPAVEADVIWVNCNESPLWSGDLAQPGDTIRTVITSGDLPRRTLIALGDPSDGFAQLGGWPYPFEGCCWQLSCAAGAWT